MSLLPQQQVSEEPQVEDTCPDSLGAHETSDRICALAELGDADGLRAAVAATAMTAASADVDRRDSRGLTALMRAAFGHRRPGPGHAGCARLLLAGGANPDARTASEVRALHLAAETGNAQVARLLLAAGANADAQTHDGWSPLMLTAVGDRPAVAELLLQCGADRGLRDALGCTADDWAAKLGHCEVLQLLRRDFCQVCRTDDCQVTFRPCGHRIACKRCSEPMYICLQCHRPVDAKEGAGGPVVDAAVFECVSASTHQPDSDADTGQDEAGKLRERIQCRVCMTACVSVAFLCGHQACSECSRQLDVCHMCRRSVTYRIRLYN